MKNKIKKWHIVLMSFVLLFVAVFASMFSLRADTVDEETGEILMDNWELDLVFYDSTINQGKTALTQIDWDASNGSYTTGDTRVITIQINYKNTQAVTTYEPGELEIGIPNLIYSDSVKIGTSYDAQWTASAVVGANDNVHTGYDWNFVSGASPDRSQEYYYFTNVKTIEEKSNFEGSIQIQYSITPTSESSEFTDQCIHNYIKTLKAHIGKSGERITFKTEIIGQETTITSPNWPNNYDANMTTSTHYWEYTSPTAEKLVIYFDPSSITESGDDFIYVYNKSGSLIKSYSGTSMAGNYCCISGNYVKIAMKSDGRAQRKGFSATIGSEALITEIIPENLIFSNEITMNYTRTYTHPWQHRQYTLDKAASKISSLDGLPAGDYYWVKYTFTIKGDAYTSYPNIGSKDHEIRDVFPSECVVLDSSLNQLTPNNNLYTIKQGYWSSSSTNNIIYVGYPKSIYNENANNLNITNTADLYSKYEDSDEYIYSDNGEVSLNLSNFEFSYSGSLYGITKEFKTYPYRNTTVSADYSVYYDSLIGKDTVIGNSGKGYARLNVSAVYTGQPMDVKFGDDLLYITGSDGNYKKLEDDEYYFSTIAFPGEIINGNNVTIPAEKYDCELWLRYENSSDYIKYEDFKNIVSTYNSKTWNFTKENKVVGYYFIVKNMTESFKSKYSSSSSSFSTIVINNAENIAESGRIYNFAYIQVFINGVLQNAPGLDSYANFITREEIATHDMNTYNTYLQRHCYSISYYKYSLPIRPAYLRVNKTMSWNQDSENECFNVMSSLALVGTLDADFYSKHELETYGGSLKDENFVAGWELYDLLPEGFTLTSTPEEIINSATTCIVSSNSYNYSTSIKVYDRNRNIIEPEDFKNLIKENTTVTIINNYKNSNRTYISIIIDLSDDLILVDHCWGYGNNDPYVSFKINSKITFDDFLEFGSTYKNTVYAFYHNRALGKNYFYPNRYYYSNSDNGYVEAIANDINQNNNSSESLMLSTNTIVISSIVSTHQDVTKYVKTNQSNYSTGTVDTLNNSEYEYKLRVRTGQNDITNLIIYDVLESAQPNRTRWTGEFLGIDTSFAEARTYKLLRPNDPNANTNGYISYNIKINPYYSENPAAGNLYNEDGTLNTNWQIYSETTDKTQVKALAFEYVNEDGTPAIIPANNLTYVLIQMKSPADENITTLARNDCRTQWNAIDEFGQTVDFITGINSNVVKVALPNSVDEDNNPSISLKFIKEINGTSAEFENMKLDRADTQTFMIKLTSLTANEDGSYNQVTALLKSNQELIISQIPVGTYLLEELGDNYFDFVEFADNNDPEIVINGVTFEQTDQGYIITVSENLTENVEFNIQVINEIEPERFYEDKDNKENLFLKNKIEENE